MYRVTSAAASLSGILGPIARGSVYALGAGTVPLLWSGHLKPNLKAGAFGLEMSVTLYSPGPGVSHPPIRNAFTS